METKTHHEALLERVPELDDAVELLERVVRPRLPSSWRNAGLLTGRIERTGPRSRSIALGMWSSEQAQAMDPRQHTAIVHAACALDSICEARGMPLELFELEMYPDGRFGFRFKEDAEHRFATPPSERAVNEANADLSTCRVFAGLEAVGALRWPSSGATGRRPLAPWARSGQTRTPSRNEPVHRPVLRSRRRRGLPS